jgi:hypothetical protein
MSTRALPLAAAVLLLLPSARAAAGTIALVVTSTAELRDGELRVAATITNAGDEAASNVRPSLSFLGREALASAHESLGPRQSFETALALPAPGLGRGRWPFRLAIDYADAGYHPFQTLQVAAIVLGDPGAVGLELIGIEPSPVTADGAVRVRVRNAAAGARETTIGLLAPRDLEVEDPSRRITMAPGAAAEVAFRLVPRTALAGSRYAVHAVVEYDEAGVHQALIGESIVEVRDRRPQLAQALAAASAALMLAWAILLLRRRSRPS